MTLIFVGSEVANRYLPNNQHRAGDLDVWTDQPVKSHIRGDGRRVDVFWHERLYDWFGSDCRAATLDELYTIKRAHAYWDVNGRWMGHVADMLRLEDVGAKFIPELHDIMYEVNESVHGKKRVSLDADVSDFFDDAVPRTYVHDSIHAAVAHPNRPLYERFLKPGSTVDMDMYAVWLADPNMVLRMFREEIYVTALERWLIPDSTFSPGRAYRLALKKTVTSLTKGSSAFFLVQHLRELLQCPDDYLTQFNNNHHLLEDL